LLIIDVDGLPEAVVQTRFPNVYQRLLERVKPERDTNSEASRRKFWWWFGRRNTDLRNSIRGLNRYIVTVKTSKHQCFQFLDTTILPDSKLICFALDDAFHLSVLSSRVHVIWSLAIGARLGFGNDPTYVKTQCFDPFPFPDATPKQKSIIRELGETLDTHRKRQQDKHPEITLTGVYNVLDKLHSGEALNEADKATHDRGLVSILKKLHDDIDHAVTDAYGWPVNLSDEDILTRLVALNHERAAEERRGLIRWLRPAYQNPTGTMAETRDQISLSIEAATSTAKPAFPATLPEQVQAIRNLLLTLDAPATAQAIASAFKGAKRDRVSDVLASLVAMGKAHGIDGDKFASADIGMAA
jgi:hypothetical protein